MPAGYPVKVNYLTGDVLTAADLNDLAGTVNLYDPTAKGDLFPATAADAVSRLAVGANDTVLTADSAAATGMKWAAPAPAAAGGLTLISTNAFSAVTTKQVINCFSATYDHYRVIFIVTAASASASIKLRFSTGGTDNATSVYDFASAGLTAGGAAANLFGNAQTSADIGRTEANSTQVQDEIFDIFYPFSSQNTGLAAVGFIEDSTNRISIAGGGRFKATTSFDGITFFPTGGNFTGTIVVYGYVK